MAEKKEEHEKSSIGSKMKEGFSVEEIESFARKHLTEVFIILAVIVATISSLFDLFTGSGLSLTLAGLAAIIALAFPEPVIKMQKNFFSFFSKQEKVMQIVIGVVRLILAIFLPFIIFLELGFYIGTGFHLLGKETVE